MTAPGWYDDPSGRFGKRWHDGTSWTAQVVGANGTVTTDPPQPPASPATPVPATPVPITPPLGGWQPEPAAGNSLAVRYRPGAGIIVSVIGLVGVLLSLLVLKWADADRGTWLDLSKTLRQVHDTSHLTTPQLVTVQYGVWGAWALLVATVVLVVLAGIPVPRTRAGNTVWRIAGTIVVGVAAVVQTITITQVFKGSPSPQAGAWIGVAGWLCVGVGLSLGARPTLPRGVGR